jgi:predicted DsbA family dithiol-disulfide isomerase
MTIAPAPRSLKVTVFTDLACPWSYLSALELREALRRCAYLPVAFDVEYRPMDVERVDTPPPPGSESTSPGRGAGTGGRESRTEFYTRRYGRARAEGRMRLVKERAKRMGVPLDMDGPAAPATRAHRLLTHAYAVHGRACQQRLLARLLSHTWISGGCIADPSALARAAVDAGLFPTARAARAFLRSMEDDDDGESEVGKATEEAREMGVGAVPCVVFGRWAVTGGQTAEAYARVIRRLVESGQDSSTLVLPLVSATA